MTARFNPNVLPHKPGTKEEHVFSMGGKVFLTVLAVIIGIIYVYNNSTKIVTVSPTKVAKTPTNISIVELPRGFKGSQYIIPITVAVNPDNVDKVINPKTLPPGLSVDFKERSCTDAQILAHDSRCGPNPFLEGVPTQEGKYTFIAEAATPVNYHLQIGW